MEIARVTTSFGRKFTTHWLVIGLLIGVPTLGAAKDDDAIIATIAGTPIRLSEVDQAGGRDLYDKVVALHRARTQSLYTLLSERLLRREAGARDITADELRQFEITDRTAAVSEAEIDQFIAQQPNMNANDPGVRRRVSLFLRVQARSDRKMLFMQTLFDKYNVSVSLDAPPSERIHGDTQPALGDPSAPVRIVSFIDYQCQYCREMSNTLHQLYERFPDKVQVIFRHFPLHADAQGLAEAALCAGDQHRFWDYHAALFATSMANASQTESIAEQLGLDRSEFDACRSEHRSRSRVLADIKEGQRLQITGTPTNFINGNRIRGAAKLNTLIVRIQEHLTVERLAISRPAASDN